MQVTVSLVEQSYIKATSQHYPVPEKQLKRLSHIDLQMIYKK